MSYPTTKISELTRGVKVEPKATPDRSLEADVDSQDWRVVCQLPGCGWRREGLRSLEAAVTKGETHSRVTALDGAAHAVLPVGRITVTGALIVWRDR